ncbi:MAG: galactokinase family protein [Clostridium sp.]|uniref:GHMP family kinase ATP-binding protein n=1 Tax=Clostridium sp. TaxID=1506 RepID=UPI0030338DFA
MRIKVSTPSRVCLFGEHQDYLGLQVIAQAINIRFHAEIEPREDNIIDIKIGSRKFNENSGHVHSWVHHSVDISKEIVYENNRDYIKSSINVILKAGYEIKNGFNIIMVSDIPMGKGMCSSSTMIIALIKAILEGINSQDKDDVKKIAHLGYVAEVEEFNEPGGMMDHYTSAIGGLVNLKFPNNTTEVCPIDKVIPGKFILFDSLMEKDTTKVLATAKNPVVNGLKKLKDKGVNGIEDFLKAEELVKLLDELEDVEKKNILANIDNFKILNDAKELFKGDEFSDKKLGNLIRRHHNNLRDGLNISTKEIEEILNTAYENGALGGKINGSGGGGCCFVYAKEEDCEKILSAVEKLGYIGAVVAPDSGLRVDKN